MTYIPEKVHEKLGLDKYCLRILRLMLVKMVYENHSMRFNELFRLVKASEVRKRGMSKPTFNDHLKHLIKKGYVKKQRKGKQYVVYFLREENLQISEARETVEGMLRAQKVMSREYRSMTVDKFAKFIADLSTIINLDQTRVLIEDVLKPSEDRFDHIIAFSLVHAYIQSLYVEMLHACMKNEEACLWALEVLEKAIDLKRKEISKLVDFENSLVA